MFTPTKRPWLIVALLTAAFTLSFMDRYLLAILVEPVKHDLGLSDTQLGFLIGTAFSICYAVFAIPLGIYADRGRGRLIVGASIFAWTLATAFCGLAQNLFQMAVARFAVGIGEAGCSPASQSMISEMFEPRRRAAPLAFFTAAGSVGLMLAFVIGSYLEEKFGWRGAFLIAALPGLPLAALTFLLIPKDLSSGREMRSLKPSDEDQHSLKAFKALFSNKAYIQLPFLGASISILMLVQMQWLPAYISRSFSVPLSEIGWDIAMLLGPVMLIGTLLGGWLADRLLSWHQASPIILIGTSIILALPPSYIMYTTSSYQICIVMASFVGFFVAVPGGPLLSLIQMVVLPNQRASAAAVLLFVGSTLAYGCGSLLIGMLSDFLAPSLGSESLRFALLITCILATCWALTHVGIVFRQRRLKPA